MRSLSSFWIVAAAATIAAALHAWNLRWTCDDAYISFRYAQHFVDGHGLVFNLDPQEAPVEGYTNFAWTMWLSVGAALGFRGDGLEGWSIVWGVLMHAGTTLTLAAMAFRCSRGAAVLPIAALGWAAHHHAASLAPAGLETAMFVLLGTLMLWLTIERRCRSHLWLLGWLAVLVAMTRPDGALFVAAAGAVVLVDAIRARAPGMVVAFAVPLLVAFVPYLLWRHAYYGHWVPNTFYAKSGGDPYPSRGWRYVVEYVKCYWMLWPAVVALPALLLRAGDRFAVVDAWAGRRPAWVLAVFVVPYLGFVLWVGGDFMFARFLLPITPLLLLALDVALQRWRRAAALAGLLLAAGIALRSEPPWLGEYLKDRNPNGFSDNRTISLKYVVPGITLADYARTAGHELQRLFAGLDVRLGIAGGHANFAYRSEVPIAIECAAGLTDAYIAHLPVPARGDVGHEKNWTMYPDYLVRRGMHFMLDLNYQTGAWIDRFRIVKFPAFPGPFEARIVVYDRELMRELKRRDAGVQFDDFEQVLDRYLAELPGKSKAQVQRDFDDCFRTYYFDHNEDAPRRQAFAAFLKAQ